MVIYDQKMSSHTAAEPSQGCLLPWTNDCHPPNCVCVCVRLLFEHMIRGWIQFLPQSSRCGYYWRAATIRGTVSTKTLKHCNLLPHAHAQGVKWSVLFVFCLSLLSPWKSPHLETKASERLVSKMNQSKSAKNWLRYASIPLVRPTSVIK